MTPQRPVLDDADFARLRLLLSRVAGLVFDESRRESLAYSVRERLRATGHGSVPEYLDAVSEAGSPERQALIDEVTIQETHFFRNPPQMRALRSHVLPELLRHAETRGRRLRIWSAGCSTGEEPYTIAMMLRELLPVAAGWDVKVIATDISEGALAAARSATYGPRAVQLASPADVARFFTASADGRVQVRQEVRDLVELRHHNLVADPPPADGLDLVLCRNVTIYFSRDTTRELMGRLHGALRDGGYLLLGHSETLWQVSEDFRLVAIGSGDSAAYVYRRLDGFGDRRSVLPDRRTEQELPLPVERRVAPRRAPRLDLPVQPAAPEVPVTGDAVQAVRDALADGRYADAERLARLAGEAEPLRADVHYLLGLALVDQGRDAEAQAPLRRAVYLDPDAGLAHFLLAGALARTGDAIAAAREYRAAAMALGPRRRRHRPRARRPQRARAGRAVRAARGPAAGERPVSGLVTFRLGEREYATPLTEVREVVRLEGLADLPGMAPPLAGVIDLRGAALPVLDLRLGERDARGDVLVLAGEDGPYGVAVDQVRAVVEDLPPAGSAHEQGLLPSYVVEVLRGSDGVVFRVDLPAMVEAARATV